MGHAICIGSDAAARKSRSRSPIVCTARGSGRSSWSASRSSRSGAASRPSIAQVLPDNRAMLDVLRDGFDAHVKWSEGVDEVEFPAAAWRIASERYSPMFTGHRGNPTDAARYAPPRGSTSPRSSA